MPNPFKPTAGKTPPVLVGRQNILEDFRFALTDGPGAPGRLRYITGPRGVGKTVMLNAIGNYARNLGWTVIDQTAERGFAEGIIQALSDHRSVQPNAITLPSASIATPVLGAEATVNLGKVELRRLEKAHNLRLAIGAKLDSLDESRQGVLITLDEVQMTSIEEIRSLAIGVQHLIREDRNVAFVFAGLPSMVEEVINDKVITFLRRAEKDHLGSVDLREIWIAFEQTISQYGKRADYQVLNELTQATNGYPFMIQLVGYWAWRYADVNGHDDRITVDDAEQGIRRAKLKLGDMVHAPAFDGLSAMAKDYLIAMSQDDGPSRTADIARRIERNAQFASVYRAQLIEEDIIEPAGYGYVDFKIPYLRDYLKEHAAHHQMKMTIRNMLREGESLKELNPKKTEPRGSES
ncbi:ATP-binding protein [Bifidobacterium simiarum]|uniref:AAA family ATPase n=1 Tax=Bifidobacterium simiarum TaxID=2045441 RepID=A0A2M9HG08_9BIFI|nr:ATP-binding protein [Bifidobacterium simiarum]PJM75765.1 AAA family ATPase [Bifidobacterium simiarum]